MGRLRKIALLPVLVFVIYLGMALVGAILPSRSLEDQGTPDHEVLLLSGPIHYDILLPLNTEVRRRFGFAQDAGLALDHPEARWLIAGWGAREFYTTTGGYGDVEAGAVMRGILGDGSVMRLDLAGVLPSDLETRWIALSRTQFQLLLGAIDDSFARNDAGEPIPLTGEGLSSNDVFFAARGRFNLFNTCNVWVGKVLRSAGLKFGRWTPLPISVRLSYALYQRS